MILTSARCWSLPTNWAAHQAIAVLGQSDTRRCNYNTDRMGLVVRNKRLLLEIHDTRFTDLELKFFTKENLMKANGHSSRPIQDNLNPNGMSWKDEYQDIPSNGQDIARLAWRNWELVSSPIFCILLVPSPVFYLDQSIHPSGSNGCWCSLPGHLRHS